MVNLAILTELWLVTDTQMDGQTNRQKDRDKAIAYTALA